MARTRTHTFSITILGLAILAVGFGIGSLITGYVLAERKSDPNIEAGSKIMSKRMTAIKKAVKEGRDDYEFEISGFHPAAK